jgi:hypothetical protein
MNNEIRKNKGSSPYLESHEIQGCGVFIFCFKMKDEETGKVYGIIYNAAISI